MSRPVHSSRFAAPRSPECNESRKQVGPVTIGAPPQEQVRAPAITVAAEQVGSVIVVHDELISFGPGQERTDAIVDIRSRKPAAILRQMSDRLVEPSFLFLDSARPPCPRPRPFWPNRTACMYSCASTVRRYGPLSSEVLRYITSH